MTIKEIRHDWSIDEIAALLDQPFNDLLFRAQSVHRARFDPNRVQVSTLLSIKTGACPEDCGYCSQSAKHDTGLQRERLLPLEEVLEAARDARDKGSTRFCMGAAWRNPTDTNLDRVVEMIEGVRGLGLETCVTLGMLTDGQAQRLADAGLDYYNHNLDTSPEFYGQVISTRTFQDRLETLDPFEFVRIIAVARILMPGSYVRLSAGRSDMSDELQALCFLAGANSIFYGERLLTTPNAASDHDRRLFERLGLTFEALDTSERVEPGPCTRQAL
jgi:biotin synthase